MNRVRGEGGRFNAGSPRQSRAQRQAAAAAAAAQAQQQQEMWAPVRDN